MRLKEKFEIRNQDMGGWKFNKLLVITLKRKLTSLSRTKTVATLTLPIRLCAKIESVLLPCI